MEPRFGLLAAAVCLTITAAAAAQSGSPPPPSPGNDDCLVCHGDGDAKRADGRSIAVEAARFGASAHGPMACVDCHADLASLKEFPHADKLAKVSCASCHVQSGQTYRDTFHGQVTSLGFVGVAKCADCHGAHDIHAPRDPRSTVSPALRVATCQQCHKAANASFVQYDPHADRHNRTRSPGLYLAGKLMDGLLLSVFGFFGLHSTLWLARGIKARSARSAEAGASAEEPGDAH